MPPEVCKEPTKTPGVDSEGKSAAKAAMDDAANDTLASELAKKTGTELGSGNAPLGEPPTGLVSLLVSMHLSTSIQGGCRELSCRSNPRKQVHQLARHLKPALLD